MQSYVRTVYGAMLDAASKVKKPHVVLPNSTLNENLGIQATTQIADTEIPGINLLVIGNNGHRVTRVNGIDVIETVPHLPTHAGLHGQIPFVLRRIDDDLPALERVKYRLRKVFQHSDGQQYVGYYAFVLDLSATQPTVNIRKVENGQTTVRPFVPTVEDLRPVKPVMETNTVLTTTGEYAYATAKIALHLTEAQVAEVVNACRILFGNESLARVTEAALCHSVDHLVTGDFNGVTQTYPEAIGCQVNTFLAIDEALNAPNKTVTRTWDVGAVEPLAVLKPV